MEKKVKRHRQAGGSTKNQSHGLPSFDLFNSAETYKLALIESFNYINTQLELEDLKDIAVDYAATHLGINIGKCTEIDTITLGKLCWLINEGANINKTDIDVLHKDLSRLHEETSNPESVNHKKQKNVFTLPVVDRKTENVLAFIEEFFDDVYTRKKNLKNPIDVFNEFSGFSLTKVEYHINQLECCYNQSLEEIKTGESTWQNKDDINQVALIFTVLKDHLKQYKSKINKQNATKPVRAKKPKKIVPSKMVMKLKYKKEDIETGIKSLQPISSVVGVDVLYVYNTRYSKLSKYIATDKTGILIKGTTLTNFDIDQSEEKTLRKPKEQLQSLQKLNKIEQRKFMDTIKTKSKKPNGRINEHCVLFKTY